MSKKFEIEVPGADDLIPIINALSRRAKEMKTSIYTDVCAQGTTVQQVCDQLIHQHAAVLYCREVREEGK